MRTSELALGVCVMGLCVGCVAGRGLAAQTVLVPTGATWSFLDTGVDPGPTWVDPGFGEPGWLSGAAQLGYGDFDETTVVGFGGDPNNKHITTWFRHEFVVADPAAFDQVILELLRDDGAVVYLNGTEVHRTNLAQGAIGAGTTALDVEGGSEEDAFGRALVDAGLLVAGPNVVAAEVHQESGTSSDLSFDLRLIGSVDELHLAMPGSTWRFLDSGVYPGATWIDGGFDDSGWASGPAQLGYGDGDEATVVGFGGVSTNKHITTWFRHVFEVGDPGDYPFLRMGVQRDDGVVVYLNGAEVMRSNLPGGTILPSTTALGAVGGAEESAFHEVFLDPADLDPGTNTLAVEIHQSSPTSSDISFDLWLRGDDGTPSLVRGAYLQMLGPDGVVVRWRTDFPAESVVRYGDAPGNLTEVVSDPTEVTEHAVSLGALSSESTYFYSVGTGTTTMAGGDVDHFFETGPVVGTAGPTRVWVLGDSGTADANAEAVRDAYLGWVTSTGGVRADLVMMLGDNAYDDGTDLEYQAAVFDMYPSLLRNTVLWPTLGNHDGHTADSASESGPYYDIFTLPRAGEVGGMASGTEAYYSFDLANIHFVCLESYETDRSVGGAMMTWLASDVASTTQEWLIAFWHHPPYSRGSHNSDTETELIEMRQNALPILEGAGVDLVLCGHSHSYERSFLLDGHYGLSGTLDPPTMVLDGGDGSESGDGAYAKASAGLAAHEGAVYAVAGSSGKTSGGQFNHPVMHIWLNSLGSMVLDIDGNRLDARFIDTAGIVRDEFTILKPAPPPVCAGDLDGDDDTDVFDFGVFSANFGQSVTPGTNGDLDGNGVVDVFDFGIFGPDFGCGT